MRTVPRRAASSLLLACLLIVPGFPAGQANHESPAATCPTTSPIPRDVVVVFDQSSSMLDRADSANATNTLTKLDAAKQAVNQFLARLSSTNDQSALVRFATGFTLEKGLDFLHTTAQSTTLSTQAKVNGLTANGATNIGGGLNLARYELMNGAPSEAPPAPYSHRARANANHIIILLSDGDETTTSGVSAPAAAATAKSLGIELYSIAVGTDISTNGLAVMQGIATDASHFYHVPNAANLPGIMQRIFAQLNDAAPPTSFIAIPRVFYDHGVYRGPSPVPGAGLASVMGPLQLPAIASDDCLLESMDWILDEAQPGGGVIVRPAVHQHVGISAGGTYRQFNMTVDCDVLPGGLTHVMHALATDFKGKTAEDTFRFVCLRPAIAARAQALSVRVTNPAAPWVTSDGASLPTPEGGHAEFRVAHPLLTAGSVKLDAHLLDDLVDGAVSVPVTYARPDNLRADARSRLADLLLTPGMSAPLRALETTATATVNADPRAGPLSLSTSSTTTLLDTGNPSGNALVATVGATACNAAPTMTVLGQATITSCAEQVTTAPGLKILRNERVKVQGLGFEELTVNGLRILLDRPEGRAEIILSQSYAGATWLGDVWFRGPDHALDRENDAGLGGDASDNRLSAAVLAPGTYGGRIGKPGDVDAYGITAVPGKKVHVDVVASTLVRGNVHALPLLPAGTADVVPFATALPGSVGVSSNMPSFDVTLLDPLGVVRDRKQVTAGTANFVELNVDLPGGWVVLVTGTPGEYTMEVVVTDAPLTHADDALRGNDAGPDCADAMLVGPGAHLGTLEDGDAQDWYRFQLDEGQVLALTLRPGDTLEAADMDLVFHGPDCQLIIAPPKVLGPLVKGSPSLVLYTVPPGASGLYRAGVLHKNGIGTYELVVATDVVAL